MTEWFFVSAWYEKADTEIHFEIANEDGEQFFFSISVQLINKKLLNNAGSGLDRFYYAEEDMLSLAVTILDDEMIEEDQEVNISENLFDKYI